MKLLVVDVGNTSTAVGLWTEGDLKKLQSVDRAFSPAMDEARRARLLHDWHRAVERSRRWAEE